MDDSKLGFVFRLCWKKVNFWTLIDCQNEKLQFFQLFLW